MTREEKEHIGKYILEMAKLLEDGCYQQEILLGAVHIIDEALEQEPTTKNNLGVDCISRQAVLNLFNKSTQYSWEMSLLKRNIEEMPSVIPQEPFINKPCVSEKQCEHDKNVVLDKIRAEIAEYGSIMVAYAITKDTKTDKGIEKLVSGVLKQAKEQVLQIIDKHISGEYKE